MVYAGHDTARSRAFAEPVVSPYFKFFLAALAIGAIVAVAMWSVVGRMAYVGYAWGLR